jgi:ABC-2 type transport system permease protein
VLNFLVSFVVLRLDLTKEKRYTLSPISKEILTNLKDVIFIRIYLDGDLPYGFKRLQQSVKEMLDEFRVYAGENLQYEFVNPSAEQDKKTRDEVFRQLYMKGLSPANLQEKDAEGAMSQKVIWPGALITFRDNEVPVDLLKSSMHMSPEENLNASVEEIEFNLISTFKKLNRDFGQRIAFIQGQGEWPEVEVADFRKSLEEYYFVEELTINGNIAALSERIEDSTGIKVQNKFELIVIAGPDSLFTEKDKYIIDQFIMYGGRALFLVDVVEASVDSLAYRNEVIAFIRNLNLDDMLFRYGARINPNLIQDVQCAVIPVNTAAPGVQPQFSPFPWVYFPLIIPGPGHNITRNLNMVKTQFVSTVDTVGENSSINKTVLLTTSPRTKVLNAPVNISLDLIRQKLNPDHFIGGQRPVAVLLEGKFTSLYENRLSPYMYDSPEIAFKAEGFPTKMVVISDGDMIRNNVKRLGYNQTPLPLGYDRYTGETYGNKDFLMNVVNYLLDESGFMQLRGREVKLRLLDQAKLAESGLLWQLVNIVLPVAIVFVCGFLVLFLRRKKFTKPLNS